MMWGPTSILSHLKISRNKVFNVKTYLDKSKTHGIGLFAAEKIKTGGLVYIPNEKLDLVLEDSAFKKLSLDERNTIEHFGYKNKNNLWHLAFDNIRFCNHSKTKSNISIGDKGYLYAVSDIEENGELLQNYSEFEELRSGLN